MIPHVTEKSLKLTKQQIYTFVCPKDIEKISIAAQIKKFYQVKVESVRTIKKLPILKKTGRKIGSGPILKKVLVKIKKGQTIPGFEAAAAGEKAKRDTEKK